MNSHIRHASRAHKVLQPVGRFISYMRLSPFHATYLGFKPVWNAPAIESIDPYLASGSNRPGKLPYQCVRGRQRLRYPKTECALEACWLDRQSSCIADHPRQSARASFPGFLDRDRGIVQADGTNAALMQKTDISTRPATRVQPQLAPSVRAPIHGRKRARVPRGQWGSNPRCPHRLRDWLRSL